MVCKNCGSEILNGYDFCMKCGTKCETSVLTSAMKLESEIAPLAVEEKRHQKGIDIKKHKKIITVVSTIVFICIVGVLLYFFIENLAVKDGYYGKTKWGMTIEEVQKIVGEDADVNMEKGLIQKTVDNFMDMSDTSSLVYYSFVNNNLDTIAIMIENANTEKSDSVAFVDIYNNINRKFTKLYGTGESDPSYLNTTDWETEKSKISILNSGKFVLVIYSDININD